MVVLNLESKRIFARRVRIYTKAFWHLRFFLCPSWAHTSDGTSMEPRILSENLGRFIEHLYAHGGSFTHAKYAFLSVKSFGSQVAYTAA